MQHKRLNNENGGLGYHNSHNTKGDDRGKCNYSAPSRGSRCRETPMSVSLLLISWTPLLGGFEGNQRIAEIMGVP